VQSSLFALPALRPAPPAARRRGRGRGGPSWAREQARRPVFQRIFWDLGPGHKPDISLEKYKAVIKLLVAATVGCQGAKN
jgi:hypothetical protein